MNEPQRPRAGSTDGRFSTSDSPTLPRTPGRRVEIHSIVVTDPHWKPEEAAKRVQPDSYNVFCLDLQAQEAERPVATAKSWVERFRRK